MIGFEKSSSCQNLVPTTDLLLQTTTYRVECTLNPAALRWALAADCASVHVHSKSSGACPNTMTHPLYPVGVVFRPACEITTTPLQMYMAKRHGILSNRKKVVKGSLWWRRFWISWCCRARPYSRWLWGGKWSSTQCTSRIVTAVRARPRLGVLHIRNLTVDLHACAPPSTI